MMLQLLGSNTTERQYWLVLRSINTSTYIHTIHQWHDYKPTRPQKARLFIQNPPLMTWITLITLFFPKRGKENKWKKRIEEQEWHRKEAEKFKCDTVVENVLQINLYVKLVQHDTGILTSTEVMKIEEKLIPV